MHPLLLVEGPLREVRELREEVIDEFGDRVRVGDIEESIDSVFDSGRLGDSPIVSFLVEYAAQIAGGGTVATIAAIRNLLQKRKVKEVTIRDISEGARIDESQEGGAADSDEASEEDGNI